jgi:hypothetical protein
VALQTISFTAADASSLEKHVAMVFTPNMFDLVRWSIDAVSRCFISGILDFFLEMGCPRPLHQLMHTAALLKIE